MGNSGIKIATGKPTAAMARETKYGTPRDNLDLDAADATSAGMSYGPWKAMHPFTRDANEDRLQAKPKARPAKVYEVTCPVCGKQFTTEHGNRVYCGDACKKEKDNIVRRKKCNTGGNKND